MWLILKTEFFKSTEAVWIVQCEQPHMRQEQGEWQSVINSMQWCLIKQMRWIRLQTERVVFSKLLFHLMNVNEEVVGGYFIAQDWMQDLSLCLIMPPVCLHVEMERCLRLQLQSPSITPGTPTQTEAERIKRARGRLRNRGTWSLSYICRECL